MKNAPNNLIRRLLPLVILVGLASPALPVSAGVNIWTTNGPEGGDIRALAIDPANPATLYAGTLGGGVFKSSNGGGSWTATGLTNTGVYALAIESVGFWDYGEEALYAGTSSGVFKSTNGGDSWRPINTGLTNTGVQALAIDPSAPTTLYAGTEGAGVFKSTNGGESWTAINTGLTSLYVKALAIDPSAPSTLYAGTFGGVFKSTNGGGSWTFTFGYNNAEVVALAIDPTTPARLYAGSAPYEWPPGGVFKSTDGGANWTDGGLSGRLVFALAIGLSAPATLYAGTDEGVFKSSNGGGSWTAINAGQANPGVVALAIDPSAAATLYAGGAGVIKSSNGGQSWTAVNAGLIASSVSALAIDPSALATPYAGTSGGGVFKSSSGGGSWTAINTGLTNPFVSALAIDPSAPATLYAGTTSGFPGFPGGVFKSTNGGESWTGINAGLASAFVTSLVIDPSAPATLYAGAGEGVFKSTDGGESWTAVNTGLTDDYHSIYALAIDPSAPATLYALTNGGIFKSINGGANWTESFVGRFFSALAVDPSASATLYAASGGIFKSSDGGGSWIAVSAGLTNTAALAIDPSSPETLYAGTFDAGVFKSTDTGGSWTPINAGLTNLTVNALAIDPSMPSRLYAGTDGGVYEVHDYLATEPCLPGPTTLCLSGGRFKVTTRWTTAAGQSGSGQAVATPGGDTGYFTFFDRDNVEVAVKVLNGCGLNAHFWTFAAGLTNVGVVMTVSDSQTGEVKTYTNPQGTPFQPIQDTAAFETCAAGATGGVRPYDGSAAEWLSPPSVVGSFDERATEPCVHSATTLCLSNSRYQVRAQWMMSDGASGEGQVINLTADTGAFWFFSPSNVEVVVKVLNGCGLNSRYWTFAGGLTDVNVILMVTDTQTGTIKTYTNPQRTPFEPIQDTSAFATCP